MGLSELKYNGSVYQIETNSYNQISTSSEFVYYSGVKYTKTTTIMTINIVYENETMKNIIIEAVLSGNSYVFDFSVSKFFIFPDGYVDLGGELQVSGTIVSETVS